MINVNKQNEIVAIIIADKKYVNSEGQTDPCHNSNSTILAELSDEHYSSSQDSPLTQELFDTNWLKETVQKCKEKPDDKHLHKKKCFIELSEPDDLYTKSQTLENNNLENVLHDSQSFIQEENSPFHDLFSSHDDDLIASDSQQVFTNDSQSYLEFNIRRKN